MADEVKIMGRVLGTNEGWDEAGDSCYVFYGFKPAEGVALPAGDLNFDWVSGQLQYYTEAGEVETTFDAIPFLASLPVHA